jgi:membrane protein
VEAAPRQRSGLELILAPVMGALLWSVALLQATRTKPKPPVPAAPPEPPALDNGWQARIGRLPVIGVAWRVNKRFGELKGNNLASSIAFSSFLSLFPLILVAVAVIGIFAAGDSSVGSSIVGRFGLQGDAASIVTDAVHTAAKSPKVAAPIGLVGLLWSGLGLVNAFQYGLDQVWQVEERGIRDKLFGLAWLTGAAILFVGAAAITTVLNFLPGFLTPLAVLVALLVNFALWMWTFMVLPNRKLPWTAHVPGALLGAAGMEALKVLGAVYLPRTVANSSALYGSIGVVFAVLAWLLLFSRLVLYSAVFNVIRWEARVGTVETTVEVPAGKGIQPSDNVTRSGRVQAADAAA